MRPVSQEVCLTSERGPTPLRFASSIQTSRGVWSNGTTPLSHCGNGGSTPLTSTRSNRPGSSSNGTTPRSHRGNAGSIPADSNRKRLCSSKEEHRFDIPKVKVRFLPRAPLASHDSPRPGDPGPGLRSRDVTFDSSAGRQKFFAACRAHHRSLGWRNTLASSKRRFPGSTPGRGAIPLRSFPSSDPRPTRALREFFLSLTPKGWAPVYETGR